jgi:hypothetical protein
MKPNAGAGPDWRNGTAGRNFFKHMLEGLKYKTRRLITDGLRDQAKNSY